MARVRVVNIRSGEPYDLYVGRAGKGQDGYFGNIYSHQNVFGTIRVKNRVEAVDKHREHFYARLVWDQKFRQRMIQVRDEAEAKIAAGEDYVLACFCWPLECHASTIAEWITANLGKELVA